MTAENPGRDKKEHKNTNQNTGRYAGFDFARAISAVGIFAVHYIQETGFRTEVPENVIIAAQEWGFIFVTVFFIMSGALLELRHSSLSSSGRNPVCEDSLPGNRKKPVKPGCSDVFRFYKKRAASIYPSFYLVYILTAVLRLAAGRETIGHFLRPEILFTVAGIDGYFASAFDTCYLIGEWFLGALIFLYILFPLLSGFMKKCELLTWAAVAALYFCFINRPLLSQAPVTNIFSCLICFMAGITFSRHRLYASRRLLIPGIVLLFVSLLPFTGEWIGLNITSHLAGAGLFFLLFCAGSPVMRQKPAEKIFSFIGSLSYPFYLVHHVIIQTGLNYLFRHMDVSEHLWQYVSAAGLWLFALSLAAAWIVDRIVKCPKRTAALKRSEKG